MDGETIDVTTGGGGAEWCMPVVSAPAGLILNDEACGTLFVND